MSQRRIAADIIFQAALKMPPYTMIFCNLARGLAEGVGFEPTVGVNPRQFSRLEP
jgi:hypothetical protein